MRLSFWRGVIAGSLLGALIGMLLYPPPRKQDERNIFRLVRISRPSRARRFLRGVSSRVSEYILR